MKRLLFCVALLTSTISIADSWDDNWLPGRDDPYNSDSSFHTSIKIVKVTNSSGRKMKITFLCEGDKTIAEQFPASTGRTRTMDAECEFPKVKIQAKIGANWQRAKVYYPMYGQSLCGKSAPSYGHASCGVYESDENSNIWWVAIDDWEANQSKTCLYVYEAGKVRVLARKCG